MSPNEYHFVFGLLPQREPFHLLHYLCLASCIAVNRPRRVVVHCLHQPWGPLWDRILPQIEVSPVPPDRLELPKQHKDTFIARFAYAHLADFVRLQILLQGGIYADMDTLFVRPLPQHLFECACVMGLERLDSSAPASSAGGSLCNAFIMAEPGSAFIRLWLERMPAAFDGTWSAHSTFLPYALSRECPELIHVEPEESFFALDWTQSGIAALFEHRVDLPAGAFSLHLWAHLWWDRARQDVSRFSAERLTPAYVRHADTTYACLARPFLPPGPGQSRLRYQGEQWADAASIAWARCPVRAVRRRLGL
jgi:hypothetical protein